jgi:hypothetical protein
MTYDSHSHGTTSTTSSNVYATVAELKAYDIVRNGGTASTDTADDAVLEDIIELVSRYMEGQTGRRFFKNSTDETRYFTADENFECFVDDLSAAPTTVSVDYSNQRSYTDIDSDDLELNPPNAALDGLPYTCMKIVPTSDAYFPTTSRGVKVVAKFGFPSVPDDVKNACLAIAANIDANRSGQSSAGSVTVTASGLVIRPQDVPAFALQTIKKYRKYL